MRAVLPAIALGVILLVAVGGVMVALALGNQPVRPTRRRREGPGLLARWWVARQAAARARADAATPWKAYCKPVGDMWEIGVRRRTDDGRTLGEHVIERIPITMPEYERLARVSDAQGRARAFNQERVGM